MSNPIDPEEMFRQIVPEMSRRLADRFVAVAAEYVRCMDTLDTLATLSKDSAVQSVVCTAKAAREVIAVTHGNQLTNEQLETVLHCIGYELLLETLN